jgi:hypothetical protein
MTPQEIIKKQAEAVTGFNKLSAAEHLEAAAKLLRQEAKQEKHPIQEFREWKERARSKGAAAFNAMGKAKQDAVNNALTGAGWKHTATFDNNGAQYYAKPGVPGTKLVIVNGKFREYAGDTTLCDWTDTKYLQAWVDKKKK